MYGTKQVINFSTSLSGGESPAWAQKIIQNPNSGFTYSPCRAKLLSTLHELLPPHLVKLFFANSGAEANDAAIKLARKITGIEDRVDSRLFSWAQIQYLVSIDRAL